MEADRDDHHDNVRRASGADEPAPNGELFYDTEIVDMARGRVSILSLGHPRLELLMPRDLLAEPTATDVVRYTTVIWYARVTVQKFHLNVHAVPGGNVAPGLTMAQDILVPRALPYHAQTPAEVERVRDLIEKVQDELEDDAARMSAGEPFTNTDYVHMDYRERNLAYLQSVLNVAGLPLHGVELLDGIQARARLAPTIRRARLLATEDPDVRGPCEVCDSGIDFSLLFVSSDILFTPYIAAYHNVSHAAKIYSGRYGDNAAHSVQAKDYLKEFQPDVLLGAIARKFNANSEVMFPRLSSCPMDENKKQGLYWGSEKRAERVRLISVGLLPIVLAFFERRVQALNPVVDTLDRVASWLDSLRRTEYPTAADANQLEQMRHNIEWVNRWTRYHQLHDSLVIKRLHLVTLEMNYSDIDRLTARLRLTRRLLREQTRISDAFLESKFAEIDAELLRLGSLPTTEADVLARIYPAPPQAAPPPVSASIAAPLGFSSGPSAALSTSTGAQKKRRGRPPGVPNSYTRRGVPKRALPTDVALATSGQGAPPPPKRQRVEESTAYRPPLDESTQHPAFADDRSDANSNSMNGLDGDNSRSVPFREEGDSLEKPDAMEDAAQ